MSNYHRNIVVYSSMMVALISCGLVWAESTADKLTKIETETLLLKAKEKQLDMESKVISKQTEISIKKNTANTSTQRAQASQFENPTVIAMEGIGKKLYATLQMQNGNTFEVQVGDVLPNGMRVSVIRNNEVLIENTKKHQTRLAMAIQSSQGFMPLPSAQSSSGMSASGMPMLSNSGNLSFPPVSSIAAPTNMMSNPTRGTIK